MAKKIVTKKIMPEQQSLGTTIMNNLVPLQRAAFRKLDIDDPFKKEAILRSNDTIIDLTNKPMSYHRVGNPIPKGNNFLGGEFIEERNDNIKKASVWKEDYNMPFGDSGKRKANANSVYYGVENNKLKVGNISKFNDNTLIVPSIQNRIIKKTYIAKGKSYYDYADKIQRTEADTLKLLDAQNKSIYANIDFPNNTKFLLHSPDTDSTKFVAANNAKFTKTAIDNFIKWNKSANIIPLDAGRNYQYISKKNQLTDEDFQEYYRNDLQREANTGYNLILDSMSDSKKSNKPRFFAGGDAWSMGLKTTAGIASMIPGGQLIGAGLGLASMAVDYFNEGDKQKAAVDKQNALTQQSNALQMEQRVDTESINQRNYGSNTQMSSFYKKGGNAKPHYAGGGNALQQVAEDGVIVNGQSHEQGGVDYGNIEVEKGETIKKEADGDFIFSTEFKPDGKQDAGAISKQLFTQKQSLQQQSGLIANDIDRQQQALKTSPSRIDSNTKGREVSRGQFKQKNLEQKIQQTDMALEQLKAMQIQWGQEKGIYDEEGNNIVADQPLNQQEEPMARQGGNFKPKYALAGGINWRDNQLDEPLDFLDTKPMVKDNSAITGFKNNIPTNYLKSTLEKSLNGLSNTPIYDINNITKKSNSKPSFFTEKNISTGLDIASTLVNFASNQQTAKNMANLKTPTYSPVESIKIGRPSMSADRQAVIQQGKSADTFAERNFANPQQVAIMRQANRNQTQGQLDKVNQYEYNAGLQVETQNAQANLQTQQINQAGFENYNQRVLGKATTDIQNQSNVTGALLKDVREGLSNREKLTQQDRMYELMKLQYQNTPGVGRDVTNAMDNTNNTTAQYLKLIQDGIIDKNSKPIKRKGGYTKPKFIAK